MEVGGKRYINYRSATDVFNIYNLADIHYGAKACNVKKFLEDVQRIKDDPFSFFFLGGDMADYIGMRDKRFSSGGLDPEITIKDLGNLGKFQCEKIAEMVDPIKHKCLGALLGNHEMSYMCQNEQMDLHGWLCTELGVPNLGYAALVDVVFVRVCGSTRLAVKAPAVYPTNIWNKNISSARETFRFALHHGYGGAVTPGGKLNSLIKLMQMFEADIYMMGHVHDQKGQRLVTIGADPACKNLIHHEKLGVITGSYLMTYAQGSGGYGEMKGYAPTPLGAVKVSIKPYTREIRGEV